MFLWAPVICEPPLASWAEISDRYTLMDVARFHEALSLKSEVSRKARRAAAAKT